MDNYQIQITTVLADKYFTKKTVLAENEFFLFTGFEDTTVTTSVHKGSSRFSVNLVVINIDSTCSKVQTKRAYNKMHNIGS